MHVLLRGDSGDRAGTIWSSVLVYQAGTTHKAQNRT
jgi:hypothetical protein